MREQSNDHEEFIHYQVRDASGQILLRSHDAPKTAFDVPLKRGFFDDGHRRYFTEWSADRTIVVQVAEMPEERAEAVQALWLGLLIPLAVVLPLAAVAIHWTVGRTTLPIKRVQQELALRDGAHLDSLSGEGLPGELMPFVTDVNRLLSRLNAALESERAFASNSAHELRNPIAAARAQVGVLASELTDPKQRQRLDGLDSALEVLSRRVETLLQLARAESGMALAREDVSLRQLVELLMTDCARKPSSAARVQFENLAKDDLIVTANADALGIAIQNLIGNALKHGPQDSTIYVRLGPGKELSIMNGGRSVPAQDLARLKERFVRASDGTREGSGLGLYIADIIAKQSGAQLELYSPARGTTAGFETLLHW